MMTNQVTRRHFLAKHCSILTLAGATLFLSSPNISAQASHSLGNGQVSEQGVSQSGHPLPPAADERWVARKPELLNQLFVRALHEGNVDAIVGLFEANAQLAARPGQPPVQGQAAIRLVVEGWLAVGLHFESSSREVIPAGDLALLRGPWQAQLTAPDGQTLTQSGHGLEIARRQPDGRWLYVLAVDGE